MRAPTLMKATAGLAIAAALFITPVAFAADAPAIAGTTLSLSATGEVSATPDMATISFGVVTSAKTAADAMKANNVRMNAVMAALKAAGIAVKDIRTSSLNLNPQYVYNNNQPPQLTGYEARNQVTVRVNDLSQTGAVIDATVKAGVNQIDQVGFGLKNDDAVLDQARQQAVATLQQRAQLYATAAGLKVKRILAIEEGSPMVVRPPMPMMAKRVMGVVADESTPVSGGELQESVTVSATFELQ